MIEFKAVYAGLNTESRMPVLRGTKRLLGLNLFKAFKELIKVPFSAGLKMFLLLDLKMPN